MATRSRRALPKALVLSFAVYLIPLVGPHAVWFWGGTLWGEFVEWRSDREALWLIADAGLALSVQAFAFGLLIWLFRRRNWPAWLALIAAVPVLPMLVNWAYLIVIPLQFLVEPETAAEQTDWPVACRVEEASVADLRSGPSLALERAGEAWILHTGTFGYAILTMPDCRVAERPILFDNAGGGLGFVVPGGAALYQTRDKASGAVTQWFLASDGTAPQRLEAPPELRVWTPVLSEDARVLAWVERRRNAAGNFSGSELMLRALPDGPTRSVPLAVAPNRSLRLIDAAGTQGPFVAEQDYHALVGLDDAGRIAWDAIQPPDLENSGDSIRLLEGGWVAWDAYREAGRYRVAWSLPHAAGRYEIPKGRSISSVAVDPSGRLIAVSVSRQLSIGEVRDAVFVIDTASGSELYRRYLPIYARSQLAFLGERHLAVSRYEGRKAWVEVLAVPGR